MKVSIKRVNNPVYGHKNQLSSDFGDIRVVHLVPIEEPEKTAGDELLDLISEIIENNKNNLASDKSDKMSATELADLARDEELFHKKYEEPVLEDLVHNKQASKKAITHIRIEDVVDHLITELMVNRKYQAEACGTIGLWPNNTYQGETEAYVIVRRNNRSSILDIRINFINHDRYANILKVSYDSNLFYDYNLSTLQPNTDSMGNIITHKNCMMKLADAFYSKYYSLT